MVSIRMLHPSSRRQYAVLMKVLVACEFSGVVRDAFALRGHDAYSCDVLPAEGKHLQTDVMKILDTGWDLMIAHPPCTALAVSGNRYYANTTARADALMFIIDLMFCDIPKICIENPVGVISSKIRKPDQIIQPYEFGDDASKKTCLWLKNLPPLPLASSLRVPGRIVEYNGKKVERWENQTDSGQNRLPPSADRAMLRSITYSGIARAMAETWE